MDNLYRATILAFDNFKHFFKPFPDIWTDNANDDNTPHTNETGVNTKNPTGNYATTQGSIGLKRVYMFMRTYMMTF